MEYLIRFQTASKVWYSVNMKIKRLDNSDVLKTAMRIVTSAKKSIKATMLAKEEAQNPLPKEYFFLLQKKLGSGVRVERIAFGSKSEIRMIKKVAEIKSKYYVFHSAPKSSYRRMLLVDGSKLMFAKTVKGKRCFYFTEDSGKIRALNSFFDKTIKRNI